MTGCQGTLPPPPPPPHQGAEVRVSCPLPLADFVTRQSRAWQDSQQARVRLVGPGEEADLLVLPPADLPRLAAAGRLERLPEALVARGSGFDWPGVLSQYRENLALWEGVPYAAPVLGEAPVCLYRADLYDTPAHQKGYRDFQAAGKPARPPVDLRAPASWDELALQAEYFLMHHPSGKPAPSLPPLPADDRELDRLFYTVAASYGRRAIRLDEPAEAGGRSELFGFHYDVESGSPRVASPAFVAALKVLQRLQACRPPQAHPRPEEAFFKGEAVLCLTDAGTAWRAQQSDLTRDRVAVCPVPGAVRYFTPAGMEVALKDTVNRVPYLGGAGSLLAVPKGARQGAAAMDLLADLTGPYRSMQIAVEPKYGGGATRADQVLRDRWGAFGLTGPRTLALKDAVSRAIYQHGLKSPLLALRTPDEAAARQALTAALRPALADGADAAKTLQGVRQRWQELIDKRGAARHASEYRISLGLLSQ